MGSTHKQHTARPHLERVTENQLFLPFKLLRDWLNIHGLGQIRERDREQCRPASREILIFLELSSSDSRDSLGSRHVQSRLAAGNVSYLMSGPGFSQIFIVSPRAFGNLIREVLSCPGNSGNKVTHVSSCLEYSYLGNAGPQSYLPYSIHFCCSPMNAIFIFCQLL